MPKSKPRSASPGKTTEEDAPRSHLVLWTALAGAVAAALAVAWVSPLLWVAPLVLAVYSRERGLDTEHLRPLFVRWAVTLFLTVLIASAFAGPRVPSGVVLGSGMVAQVRDWLAGAGAPVWGAGWMAIMAVALAGLSAVSGGLLGAFLVAILAANAAVSASMVYANGTNIFTTSLVALAPWQWAFLAGAVLIVPPLARLSLQRLYRRPGPDPEPAALRRELMIAGGLLALAIVLRISLSPVYTWAAQRLTHP
jgi:hypothetical protein